MQHTNTSSMSGGSTTSLFYRDLGARWLTTRSKNGIRRSNKNRWTLSNSPIYGWWRPAWNLSFEGRVRNVALIGSDASPANMPYSMSATTRGIEAPPRHWRTFHVDEDRRLAGSRGLPGSPNIARTTSGTAQLTCEMVSPRDATPLGRPSRTVSRCHAAPPPLDELMRLLRPPSARPGPPGRRLGRRRLASERHPRLASRATRDPRLRPRRRAHCATARACGRPPQSRD